MNKRLKIFFLNYSVDFEAIQDGTKNEIYIFMFVHFCE